MIYESSDVLITALVVWFPLMAVGLGFAWWKRGPLIAKGLASLFAIVLVAAAFVPAPWGAVAALIAPFGLAVLGARRSTGRLTQTELDDSLPTEIPPDVDSVLWAFGTLGFEPPSFATARDRRSTSHRAYLLHGSRGLRAQVGWVPGWTRSASAVTSRFAVGGLVTANVRAVVEPSEDTLRQVVVRASPEALVASHANALAHLKSRGLIVVELQPEPASEIAQADVNRLIDWLARAPWRRSLVYMWRLRRGGSSDSSLLAAQPGIEARIAALVAIQPSVEPEKQVGE